MRKAGVPVGNTRGVGERAANLRAGDYGVLGGKNFVANLTQSMYEAPFDVTTRALPAGETFDSFNKKCAPVSIACIEGHVQPKSISCVNRRRSASAMGSL